MNSIDYWKRVRAEQQALKEKFPIVYCFLVSLAGDNATAGTVAELSTDNAAKAILAGFANMVRGTLFNVIAVIAQNGDYSLTNNVGVDTYPVDQLWIDADNAGNGVYGSLDTN